MDILKTADNLINGEKRQAYGPARESFTLIADMWSMFLDREISPEQVAMMMVLFKVAREKNRHNEDNLVDICGYAALAQIIRDEAPLYNDFSPEIKQNG